MDKVDIKNKHIIIQGWMRTELGLKDNELILYAFIFGFCQDGVGKYEGSLAYIEEWLGIAPKNIRARLKSLIDKGCLIKNEKIVNGVKYCSYQTIIPESIKQGRYETYPLGTKHTEGGYETTSGGGYETYPNNKDYNNKDKIKVGRKDEKNKTKTDETTDFYLPTRLLFNLFINLYNAKSTKPYGQSKSEDNAINEIISICKTESNIRLFFEYINKKEQRLYAFHIGAIAQMADEIFDKACVWDNKQKQKGQADEIKKQKAREHAEQQKIISEQKRLEEQQSFQRQERKNKVYARLEELKPDFKKSQRISFKQNLAFSIAESITDLTDFSILQKYEEIINELK